MRPKIRLKLSKFDVLIETLIILVIASNISMVAYAWIKLPEIIPIHFNAAGEIDGYGGKANLLILLLTTIAMYLGLTALNRFPHAYNYIVEINSTNAETQYRYATRMLRVLKFEIMILFTYMELAMIRSAFEKASTLGVLFLPVTLLGVFGTLGYYIYKSVKAS